MENNHPTSSVAARPPNKHWLKAIVSFLVVLLTMPLGHVLMILMEHLITDKSMLHYSAFFMGAVGVVMVIAGVFAKGDTKQTLWGFFGGLLFWTGWVEFVFVYYAHRYGVMPEIVNGEIVTKPEYLIMPSSFGFWVMFMLLYIFSAKSACNFFNWIQRAVFRNRKNMIVARPMTRHTAIITFMELNMMLWSSYLLLMFCYDTNFLGERHPMTLLIGLICLVGSVFIFRKQLRLSSWGANIRMAIATVIVFWTPIEIMGRLNLFNEIWTDPLGHKTEVIVILVTFLLLVVYLSYAAYKGKRHH